MRKPEWSESLELEIHFAAMNIDAGDNLTTELKYQEQLHKTDSSEDGEGCRRQKTLRLT